MADLVPIPSSSLGVYVGCGGLGTAWVVEIPGIFFVNFGQIVQPTYTSGKAKIGTE